MGGNKGPFQRATFKVRQVLAENGGMSRGWKRGAFQQREQRAEAVMGGPRPHRGGGGGGGGDSSHKLAETSAGSTGRRQERGASLALGRLSSRLMRGWINIFILETRRKGSSFDITEFGHRSRVRKKDK